MRVEQRAADLVGRVVRPEGAADIGDPRILRAAAADILGDGDAERGVAAIAEHAAEAGDAGRGGAGALGETGDRKVEGSPRIVDEDGRNFRHRGRHLRL